MTLNLVVIDDDEDLRSSFEDIVRGMGCNPICFETATQCLEYLTKPENQYPNGYLVDMRIPIDLEGPEKLYNYLKQNKQHKNFFFITANLSEHDSQVIGRTGADYFLKKIPEVIDMFLEKVSKQHNL